MTARRGYPPGVEALYGAAVQPHRNYPPLPGNPVAVGGRSPTRTQTMNRLPPKRPEGPVVEAVEIALSTLDEILLEGFIPELAGTARTKIVGRIVPEDELAETDRP
jgi:hypothetical protein